jgi:hypothetical protein
LGFDSVIVSLFSALVFLLGLLPLKIYLSCSAALASQALIRDPRPSAVIRGKGVPAAELRRSASDSMNGHVLIPAIVVLRHWPRILSPDLAISADFLGKCLAPRA